MSLAEGSPFENQGLHNHRALNCRRDHKFPKWATGSVEKQGRSYFCPWFLDSYMCPTGGRTPYKGHVFRVYVPWRMAIFKLASQLCLQRAIPPSVSSSFWTARSVIGLCSVGHTSFARISCGLPSWWIKHSLNLQMGLGGVGWGSEARKGKSLPGCAV